MALNNNSCPFCQIVNRNRSAVILREENDVMAFMDQFPATPGHILVIPKRHIETIFEMPEELGARLMAMAVSLTKAIQECLQPAGLNLIQSNKKAGGQTVPHFHLHIVPRYYDDGIQIRFGHGKLPASTEELQRIAAKIKGL